MPVENVEYAGFWLRVGVLLIHTVLVVLATVPLLMAPYGLSYVTGSNPGGSGGLADFLLSWVLPAVVVIVFWLTKQATSGKMVISARVVDARTGGTLSLGQSIGRYLGYFASTIPFGLGLLWVAFDARKQRWHDKLAGNVVVRSRP